MVKEYLEKYLIELVEERILIEHEYTDCENKIKENISFIALLEEKIEKCDAEILKYGSDFVKLRELGEERDRLEKELEEKMSRWEYLEDLNDRIISQ